VKEEEKKVVELPNNLFIQINQEHYRWANGGSDNSQNKPSQTAAEPREGEGIQFSLTSLVGLLEIEIVTKKNRRRDGTGERGEEGL